jgi:hypothetical protein
MSREERKTAQIWASIEKMQKKESTSITMDGNSHGGSALSIVAPSSSPNSSSSDVGAVGVSSEGPSRKKSKKSKKKVREDKDCDNLSSNSISSSDASKVLIMHKSDSQAWRRGPFVPPKKKWVSRWEYNHPPRTNTVVAANIPAIGSSEANNVHHHHEIIISPKDERTTKEKLLLTQPHMQPSIENNNDADDARHENSRDRMDEDDSSHRRLNPVKDNDDAGTEKNNTSLRPSPSYAEKSAPTNENNPSTEEQEHTPTAASIIRQHDVESTSEEHLPALEKDETVVEEEEEEGEEKKVVVAGAAKVIAGHTATVASPRKETKKDLMLISSTAQDEVEVTEKNDANVHHWSMDENVVTRSPRSSSSAYPPIQQRNDRESQDKDGQLNANQTSTRSNDNHNHNNNKNEIMERTCQEDHENGGEVLKTLVEEERRASRSPTTTTNTNNNALPEKIQMNIMGSRRKRKSLWDVGDPRKKHVMKMDTISPATEEDDTRYENPTPRNTQLNVHAGGGGRFYATNHGPNNHSHSSSIHSSSSSHHHPHSQLLPARSRYGPNSNSNSNSLSVPPRGRSWNNSHSSSHYNR